jgi:peptide/nickel transport system substrate-binding protein
MSRGAGVIVLAALLAGAGVMPSLAQEAPRKGGILTFAVNADPPSYDCQTTTTFVAVQTLNPHYSQLVKFDPDNYPNLKPDVAESWTIAPDNLSITFKIKRGVKFHDGSDLTARDVVATFERIRNPPAGVISVRKPQFEDIAAIEAPDPFTVVFKLSQKSASIMTAIASPWNCLYSAAKLEADPKFPERNIMGSGPYRFVSHVKGSHWEGRRFDEYHEAGKPYLDGFKIHFMAGTAMVNALQGGQIMAEFRGVSPAERDKLKTALGDKITISESPWSCKFDIFFNVKKKPFDDPRVRRALSLAIDRWGGAQALARIAFVRDVGGVLRPGSEFATAPQALEPRPGFGRDSAAAKAEARRLLREAGVEGLKFELLSRNVPMPYSPVGIMLIDQWRQIGVAVEHKPLDVRTQKQTFLNATYDVGLDANCYDLDEPDAELSLYISADRSPRNLSHATDRDLDALFEMQKREPDAAKRRELIARFEARAIEQGYVVPIVWWHRIVAHTPQLRGWKVLSSHYLNQDLAGVWLAQ